MPETDLPAQGIFLKDLIGQEAFDELFPDGKLLEFRPGAIFIKGLDTFLFLAEDCSYTEIPINKNLSIMRHPKDGRVVGVQLHGFTKMYEEAFLLVPR